MRTPFGLRLIIALQFLTRLPLSRALPFNDRLLNESARHFPAVGALVGAIGAAVLALALTVFPPALSVVLAIAATIAATGAFHEDGLADTADALGAHGDRARSLDIMKDSRVGTYGVLALALRLALEAAALTALLAKGLAPTCAAWIFAHAVSRFVAVLLIASLPYAGDVERARAKPLAHAVDRRTLTVAALWTAAAAIAAAAFVPWPALGAALLAAAAAGAILRRALARWLGGYTGDTLGAAQQAALLALLLALLGALA